MKFRVSFIGSVLISEFEFSRLMLYIGYKLHHLYIYIYVCIFWCERDLITNFHLQRNRFYVLFGAVD